MAASDWIKLFGITTTADSDANSDSNSDWLKDYESPFVQQANVRCRIKHRHASNRAAATFVLFRYVDEGPGRLEILFEQRSDDRSWQLAAGGFLQDDETVEECVWREAREEYGLTQEDIIMYPFQYAHDHGRQIKYTYIWGQIKDASREINPVSAESLQTRWVRLSRVGAALMEPVEPLADDIFHIRHLTEMVILNHLRATMASSS